MTAKKSDETTRGSERTTAKPGNALSGGERSESGNETEISFPSDREILITRVFNAPRDRVFQAFCDPKLIPEWWGPARYPTTVEVMDVRPGGKWRYVSRAEDGTEFGFHGEYREIVPPERVSQTFEFEGMPGHLSIDTATFEEIGGKTRLTIRSAFASKEDRDGMVQSGMESGLRESHERFEALMARPTNEVVITRIFEAPRERVWRAWTDPRQVQRWWGPKHFTTPVCEIDLRVGGTYRYCMRSPEGKDFWGTGVYREIVPMERIVYTDSFADEKGNVVPATHYGMSADIPLEMLVTVTFENFGGKTRLTLRHLGIPKGPDYEGAHEGWSQSFDKLAEELAKG